MEMKRSVSFSRIYPDSPLIVGFSKTSARVTLVWNSLRTLDISVMAFSECPPSSKKLASIPIGAGTSSIADQVSANFFSILSRGAVYSDWTFLSGSGNKFRFNFPLGVNGIFSNVIKQEGIMYPGSASARYSFNPGKTDAWPGSSAFFHTI